jgi:hypothetical protein
VLEIQFEGAERENKRIRNAGKRSSKTSLYSLQKMAQQSLIGHFTALPWAVAFFSVLTHLHLI